MLLPIDGNCRPPPRAVVRLAFDLIAEKDKKKQISATLKRKTSNANVSSKDWANKFIFHTSWQYSKSLPKKFQTRNKKTSMFV